MKRIIALILVATSFVVFSNVSSAAIKPGTTCSPKGKTTIFGGVKFTCVLNGKKLVWNNGIKMVTTSTTSVLLPTTTVATQLSADGHPLALISTDSIQTCEITDQRINQIQNNNVGFPLSSREIVTKGTVNVVLMPIDFSDAPGTQSPTTIFQPIMDQMSSWVKEFSNKKLTYNIQSGSSWIRAPKPSSDYKVPVRIAGNTYVDLQNYQNSVAQSFIDASGSQFNFKNVTAVFFYFSSTPSGIPNGMDGRNAALQTKQGQINTLYYGPGTYSNSHPSTMGQLFIHEMLHSQGLAGHAPGNGFITGVMQNQDGSGVLDAWSTFLLDWFEPSQVFCVSKSEVSGQYVELTPLEVVEGGFKSLMIPISSHEILVVESRRPVGFSSLWENTDKGIFVYKVDTTMDNDRSHESSGDTGNDVAFSKYAYYLHPDSRPSSNDSGISKYQNYLVKAGESVTYAGIKISLILSGDQDLIHIEAS